MRSLGRLRLRLHDLARLVALLIVPPIAAAAQQPTLPRLHTNQAIVEDAMRDTSLAINDPLAVFAYVLDQLPDQVTVYPTENYYYFRFVHAGVPYAGDIRLDAEDRDQGRVHFGYYEKLADWRPEGQGVDVDVTLGPNQGVSVEKIAPLTYRIASRQKRVVFALNDLSGVKPPAEAIAANETYLGPIFDEFGDPFLSAVQREAQDFSLCPG